MRLKTLFLILLIFCWLGFTDYAQASICGNRYGQEVCVLKLKRSAKNYWEYRAKVSINGIRQTAQEIYNCREQTLTRKGKYPIPLPNQGPGILVCKTFKKQISTSQPGAW